MALLQDYQLEKLYLKPRQWYIKKVCGTPPSSHLEHIYEYDDVQVTIKNHVAILQHI